MRRLRQETPRSEHGYLARNAAAGGCGHRGSRLLPGVVIDDAADALPLASALKKGGLDMLSALAAPFSGIKFIPTGGINPANVAGYLCHPAVLGRGA